MLSEAIHTIKVCEGSTIAIVQDELGYALGRKGGSAIERWRQGYLPPTMDDRETLARLLIERSCGRLDQEWLRSFLRSMKHPYSQQFGDELLSKAQTIDSGPPTLPLPAWVKSDNVLVGRTVELDRLAELWQAARGGLNQAVFATGEAGIGKTRLLYEFISRQRRGESVWLAARAYKGYQSTPYLVLAEAIQPLLNSGMVPGVADEVLVEIGRLIPGTVTFPTNGPSFPSPEPEQAYARKRWALNNLLTALAAKRPLILWLDDLHWCDRGTLESVQQLLLRNPRQRLLLVASLRDTDVEEGSYLTEVWANLHRSGLLTEIPLAPLSQEETRQLIQSRYQRPDVDAFSRRLHTHTEGNPFFLLETVELLLEEDITAATGIEGAAEPTNSTMLPIPDSVEDLIQLRLQVLKEMERQFAEIAAVVGREFDPDLIQRVAEMDERQMADTIAVLQERGVIREQGEQYDFSHAMLRTAIYQGLSAWPRRRWHRQVGQKLAELAGDTPSAMDLQQLAQHFYQAHAWPEAFTYQLRAGVETLALFETRAAHTYLKTAKALAQTKLKTITPEQQRILWEGLGDVHSNLARFDQALAYYRDALALRSPNTAGAAALCWKMATVYERQTHYDEAIRWLERGMVALEGERDDNVFSRICIQYGLINTRRGNLDAAFSWATRALVVESAQAHNLLATLHRAQGDLEKADTHCTQAIELARANGQLFDLAKAYTNLGVIRFAQNAWESAATAYQQAIEFHANTDNAYAYIMTLCNLSDVERHLGNLEEASRHAQRGVDEAQRLGAAFSQAHAHYNLGAALLATGEVYRARVEHLEVARQLLDEKGIKELLCEIECTLAEALLQEGMPEEAARAAGRALALAKEQDAPLDLGRARRIQAELLLAQAEVGEAAQLLEQSADILQKHDFRYELARTYLVLARLHGQNNERRAEATTVLEEARTILEELGAQLDLDRADTLAREMGL